MIVPAEKASEMWCPFARITWAKMNGEGMNWSTTGAPAFNRARIEKSNNEVLIAQCVANECMAWRHAHVETILAENPDEKPKNILHGYCGLAGRP